jgi:hypothetical protein
VLRKIGQAGKQMRQNVEQATGRAARSTDTFNRRTAALGSAVTTLSGVLSVAARAAAWLAEEKASLPRWTYPREYEGEFRGDDLTLFPAELIAAALSDDVAPFLAEAS